MEKHLYKHLSKLDSIYKSKQELYHYIDTLLENLDKEIFDMKEKLK